MVKMKIHWIDREREPQCPPDPKFPQGVDVDISAGAPMTCVTDLPYPAPRCGFYSIKCEKCGESVLVTTAGRPDDPRSVKIACNPRPN